MPTRRTLLAATALASLLAAPVKLLRHAAAQEATPEGLTLPGTPTGDQWLAQWSPGQTAMINGAALYYEDHGDPAGHPVLLLHGGLANSESWLNLAPVLAAAGYRVIMVDSRGHGRS